MNTMVISGCAGSHFKIKSNRFFFEMLATNFVSHNNIKYDK